VIPFFPRVLVHLVGLDHVIAQRVAVEVEPGVLLEPVPQGQQLFAIAAQLAGHLRRGRALSDAAEDHQELRGAAMGPLQEGPREGVEDPATAAALVVHEGRAMARVEPQTLPPRVAGAGQAAGVEQIDECGVADVLIEIVEQGEVHGRDLRASSCIPLARYVG
jgi:hypothetical protein